MNGGQIISYAEHYERSRLTMQPHAVLSARESAHDKGIKPVMMIRLGINVIAAILVTATAARAEWTVADSLAKLPPPPAKNTTLQPQTMARRARPNIIYQDPVGTAFVIPVVGSTPGAFGTFYRSEVVMSNYKNAPQRISISILRQGVSSGQDPVVIRELPSYELDGDLGLVEEDFLASLGKSGLAAIVVQAVDSAGNPDSTAMIDGFSRIWTVQPTSSGCSNPNGTVSQSLLTVPPNSITGTQYSGFAVGMRQDENFRTNIGIVNMSPDTHTWEVDVTGTRGDTSFTVSVPAQSMNQFALPNGLFGHIAVTFTATGTGNDYRWAAYASSVDNRTGDGWTREASY